jgi:hypothetical protein
MPERGDAMKKLAMRSAAQASAAFGFPAIAGRVGTRASSTNICRRSLPTGSEIASFEVHAENYMGVGVRPGKLACKSDSPLSLRSFGP